MPYCVTVDFDYIEKGTVTVRDRETTRQIRLSKEKVGEVIGALLRRQIKFEDAGELIKS